MRKTFLIVTLSFLTFYSCSPWKKQLLPSGDTNDAIHNAIVDFVHSSRLSKKDSVYHIYSENINQNLKGVAIFASDNELLVSTKDSISYSYDAFLTQYLEIKGNLFYWYDSTKTLTEKAIAEYKKFNLIDTTIINIYIPATLVDDSKKGMDYYFCKDNLLKYRKVKTRKAMGYYEPPKVKCNIR